MWILYQMVRKLVFGIDDDAAKGLPPFPHQQLLILAICRIAEPIAFMSIFPYIYFMIEDFHITDDANKIAIYAGMVTSAFTFAEFSTGVMWGRISDRVGRKPVLMMGLVGTAISAVIFGFATNLPLALFARALGGLLNGNIAVLQTTVAELAVVKEHQAQAFSIMPLVWCLGSIIGPMIGGALARPCINFPSVFRPGTIWEQYPYLLPNLFSAVAVCVGVTVNVLFLKETHPEKKQNRDRGVELGERLTSWMSSKCNAKYRKAEKQALLDDDELLPGYSTLQNSPLLLSTGGEEPQEPLDLTKTIVPVPQPPKIFTRMVILNIVSYGILAFHTMAFDQQFPVFLATAPPDKGENFNLPLKFVGGFGFESAQVGWVLAVQGGYSIFSTSCLVSQFMERIGPLRVYKFLALTYFLLYLTTPYLVLLPENLRMTGIYVLIVWKCTFSTLAYPANAILLSNSAPSLTLLGTINGFAASMASFCRAIGPSISGWLYAVGLQTGYSGLSWWVCALVTLVGAYIATQLEEPRGRYHQPTAAPDVENVIETAPSESITERPGSSRSSRNSIV